MPRTLSKPNLFIVGAPKCGTTSLAAYLSSHPRVFFSPVKEPHYFNTDNPPRNIDTLADYERLFRKARPPGHSIVGEASTGYLASQTAIPAILAYADEPRFIVCLRSPLEMAPALHEEQIAQGNEHIRNFDEAWHMCGERAQGRAVSVWCLSPRRLDYAYICSLGSHLERLFGLVPAERILPVLLDDMRADPRACYRGVLDFLGLDDDGRRDFPPLNTAKELRSTAVKRFVVVAGRAKRAVGVTSRGLGFLHRVNQANLRIRPRQQLPPTLHRELRDFFRPEVEKMSSLLGRDLGHWLA